jgi:hypothetical protein
LGDPNRTVDAVFVGSLNGQRDSFTLRSSLLHAEINACSSKSSPN